MAVQSFRASVFLWQFFTYQLGISTTETQKHGSSGRGIICEPELAEDQFEVFSEDLVVKFKGVVRFVAGGDHYYVFSADPDRAGKKVVSGDLPQIAERNFVFKFILERGAVCQQRNPLIWRSRAPGIFKPVAILRYKGVVLIPPPGKVSCGHTITPFLAVFKKERFNPLFT